MFTHHPLAFSALLFLGVAIVLTPWPLVLHRYDEFERWLETVDPMPLIRWCDRISQFGFVAAAAILTGLAVAAPLVVLAQRMQ